MKKTSGILVNLLKGLGCVFVIPLFCIGLVVINMVYNEIRNYLYADQLYSYPLPPRTDVKRRETICFCPPNGGTCAISFDQTMVTSLNQNQVKAYYANIWFPPLRKKPIPDESQRVGVGLTFGNSAESDGRMQVTASIGEPFYDSGLDPRCVNW